jgi:HEAT repeat protein
MTRLICILAGLALLPIGAAAQDLPAAPPVPVAPAAPPVPAAPPTPGLPVEPAVPVVAPSPHAAPWPVVEPFHFDLGDLNLRLDDLRIRLNDEMPLRIANAQDRVRDAEGRIRDAQARVAGEIAAGLRSPGFQFPMPHELQSGRPFELQGPGAGPYIGPRGRAAGDESNTYNSGLNELQRRQYDRAITLFDRVFAQKGIHADAALYWKAFSQARLVRTEEALESLAVLRRDYPQSRYSNEAKVLEADVRKLAGQRVDPQTLDANDEIKLMAINGIANTEPERAIPLLEGVLNATNTLGNKRRALFLLAMSKDARAHQILLRYAKGAGNPELQVEAIRSLVSRRDKQTTDAELREIYESTQDAGIRRAIIDAYGNAGDKGALMVIIKDKNEAVELKRSAINRLNGLAAPTELWAIYQQETDPELRMQALNVFMSMSAIDQITQIAKTEKDPQVRLRAVRHLGGQKVEQAGQVLVDLYAADQDRDVRRAVISALRSQNNADGLVAIARKETSLDLKREIVSAISNMAPKNKAAADYLMEVIK